MSGVTPIPTDTYKIGFIGAGKMAESIARGVVESNILPASRISTAHSGSGRRDAFQSFGVKVRDHNKKIPEGENLDSLKLRKTENLKEEKSQYDGRVVQDSDVVIFSVKPQIVKDVLLDLRPLLSEKQLLVSVAAGVKLKDLQEWAGHSRFIRVMPNTPAAVGKAASVISLGAAATEEDGELISKLFGAIGKIWIADEKHFDAITGLSGSGPAYIFLAIEALADGGVAAGLPRELALGLASQT
ncbi:hypothetical protein RJ640_000296, partial [Escallonia rubra]